MRVAAVDVGTNSTRLLIADVEGGRLRVVERLSEVTGLGAGVDERGHLGEAAVTATVAVLAGYGARVRAAGAERVRAIATAAVRAAAEDGGLAERARAALGCGLEVVTGEEEAALSFAGAVTAAAGPAPFLVVDVGGGSTEFVFGAEAPSFLCSVNLGSRRLTERFFPSLPAGREAVAAARRAAAEAFAHVALPGGPGTVICSGGTWTALAALAGEPVHGVRLTQATVDGLADQLCSLAVADVAALPRVDPRRAPVLAGGAIVAGEALRRSGAPEAVISVADLLDGIALALSRPTAR